MSPSHPPMIKFWGGPCGPGGAGGVLPGQAGGRGDVPLGEEELVAKVGGKGFAFIGLAGGTVSVKCGRDAAEAGEWRERYPGAVTSSHYVGRYGWNSVDWTGPVPDDEVRELIDASYDAAVAALPKSRRPS
ncbi:MmcQ/YjbR family DNA-binding protein [Blastococcus tunisiensis]|nr:MmcQ/YjbR family DNA-binding protein [Blastococcus sp. DSM 46838]